MTESIKLSALTSLNLRILEQLSCLSSGRFSLNRNTLLVEETLEERNSKTGKDSKKGKDNRRKKESHNEREKDVFFEVKFTSNQQELPFFISASANLLPSQNLFACKGIKKFVTASCLFGAALQAEDHKGANFSMIQHKIPFQPGERIIGFQLDKNFHPYELAQFAFLEKIAPLMKSLSISDEKPSMLYHLPDVDYVLSMIKLYIYNQLDYHVLVELFPRIQERAIRHRDIITGVFVQHDIELEIQSPFSNLFSDFFAIQRIDEILDLLNIQKGEQHFSKSKAIEQAVVARMLELLTKNNFFIPHQTVWLDLCKTNKGRDRITTLELLFKLANASMIAIAANGLPDNTVCSILPLNEKPIFQKYARTAELLQECQLNYPSVLSLVFLEHLICYCSCSLGPSFYFKYCENELTWRLEQGMLGSQEMDYISRNDSLSLAGISKNKESEVSQKNRVQTMSDMDVSQKRSLILGEQWKIRAICHTIPDKENEAKVDDKSRLPLSKSDSEVIARQRNSWYSESSDVKQEVVVTTSPVECK